MRGSESIEPQTQTRATVAPLKANTTPKPASTLSSNRKMTLKEKFNNLRSDLHELKAAGQAHNVASYEPPTNSKPAEDSSASASNTSDKLPSSLPATTQPSTDAAVTQSESAAIAPALPSSHDVVVEPEPTAAYILPPPPPKNLPHGWTARYDNKEGKFSYSHGVDSKNEQWNFRKESPYPW